MIRTVVIDIAPMGKPRITRQGKYDPKLKPYWGYCELIRATFWNLGIRALPGNLSMVFSFRRPAGVKTERHEKRPDVDNLQKAALDSLFKNDGLVYKITAEKVYGPDQICITFDDTLPGHEIKRPGQY